MSHRIGQRFKTAWAHLAGLARPPAARPAPQSLALDALHIFALCGFAVAQPVFSLTLSHPIAIEDQNLTALLLIVALVSLAVPAVLVLAEVVAARFGRGLREQLHLSFVFILFTLFLLPLTRYGKPIFGMLLVLLAVALGGFCTELYRRSRSVRQVVTLAALGNLLFPILFLTQAPIWQAEPLKIAPMEVRNPVPIVMLVFDEFCGTSLMNADQEIDAARYPHFAELARHATWFRNSTSVHPATKSAVPAILTGVSPKTNLPPSIIAHPQNLFSLLQATGQYELLAFEPYTRLYPISLEKSHKRAAASRQPAALLQSVSIVYLWHLAPADLSEWLPEIPLTWFGLDASRYVERSRKRGLMRYDWEADRDVQFAHFLDCLGSPEKPALYFAHFALPHVPWCYLPSGHKYRLDAGALWERRAMGGYGLREELWDQDEFAVLQGYQRYLLQLGYLDSLVGKLMDRLKSEGLFDRCLFILTADHGVSFQPGQSRRAVTDANLPDILSTPLFIKAPGQTEGAVSDRNVEAIDVFPTIVDVLGAKLMQPVDGASVFDATRPERPRKLFYNEEQLVTVDPAFPTKSQTLRRMIESFGSGSYAGLFKIGPHPALLGRPLDDLELAGRSPIKIDLLKRRVHSTLEADAKQLVPCYFEGTVRSPAPLPIELAISINGTIQAVTRTYLTKGIDKTWTALAPETAIRRGENQIRIFVIVNENGRLVLQECTPEGLPPRVYAPDETAPRSVSPRIQAHHSALRQRHTSQASQPKLTAAIDSAQSS